MSTKFRKISLSILGIIMVLALLLVNVNFNVNDHGKLSVTVGNTVNAAGIVPDIAGTNSIAVQQALDLVAATGGEVSFVSPAYVFTGTVSRAIDNVVFKLNGATISNDDSTPLFDIGIQSGWSFYDGNMDAGGITYTSASDYTISNVWIDTTHYPLLTDGTLTATDLDAPTGRTATYVIAASDALAHEIAQADYVCDGTADNVEIQAAIDALPAGGGEILLTDGTFYVNAVAFDTIGADQTAAGIVIPSNVTLTGKGHNTIIYLNNSQLATVRWTAVIMNHDVNTGNTGIVIRNLQINGNKANQIVPTHYLDWEGINFKNVTNSSVSGVLARNCIDSGIDLDGSDYNFVNNNILISNNGWAVHCSTGSDDNTISNNVSQTNGQTNNRGGFDSNGENCIVNNTSYQDWVAIALLGKSQVIGNKITSHQKPDDSGSIEVSTGCSGSLIADNIVTGGTRAIFQKSTVTDLIIKGNVFTNQNWVPVSLSLDNQRNLIIENNFTNSGNAGLTIGGADNNISCNYFYTIVSHGIRVLAATGKNNLIQGNIFKTVTGSAVTIEDAAGTGNRIIDNMMSTVAIGVVDASKVAVIRGNTGYIAPGEVRTFSGSITKTGSTLTDGTGTFTGSVIALKPGANTVDCTVAGTATIVLPVGSTGTAASGTMTVTDSPKALVAGSNVIETTGATGNITVTINSIGFAWHNPEAQDIFITKVLTYNTTAGGTATSVLDIGIADDAVATNRGVEFFDDLDANSTGVKDSLVAGDGGTQTKWVLCQDSASATDGWVVGSFLVELANNFVGTYYIEYVGK